MDCVVIGGALHVPWFGEEVTLLTGPSTGWGRRRRELLFLCDWRRKRHGWSISWQFVHFEGSTLDGVHLMLLLWQKSQALEILRNLGRRIDSPVLGGIDTKKARSKVLLFLPQYVLFREVFSIVKEVFWDWFRKL